MVEKTYSPADDNHAPIDPGVAELERKAEELTKLVYALSEKRLAKANGALSPELKALGASTVAFQKAIVSFLAVEKLCQ